MVDINGDSDILCDRRLDRSLTELQRFVFCIDYQQ